MKKAFLPLLAMVLIFSIAHSQSKKQNSLLWKISGNGLKTPSYLFGTDHAIGKNLVDRLPYIKTYFNKCEVVAGEIVLDSTASAKMAEAIMLPDTLTLDKIFTVDEYKLIVDYVKRTKPLDESLFKQLTPVGLATMLTTSSTTETAGNTNPGLDLYFQEEGKRLNKKVIELETMEDQIALSYNIPMAEQKAELLKTILKKDREKEKEKKTTAQLHKFYIQQDLDGFEKLSNATDEDTPEITERALYKRNRKWLAELPAVMKAQPTFIAVGAMHLIGQKGLINQLRLKGYTVKPVKI